MSEPNHNDLLVQKAVEHLAGGDSVTSYNLLVSVVADEPTHKGALYYLGNALHNMGKFQAAATAFKRCSALAPDEPTTLLNAGWNEFLCGREVSAKAMLDKAIKLAPHLHMAHTDLSQCEMNLGDVGASLKAARMGVHLGGLDPIAHFALASALFFNNQWLEGFKEFEARFRWKLKEFLNYPYPRWDGSRVGTLYIQAEQGLGDTMLLLRYMPEVAKRADRVIFYVHQHARGLCQAMLPANVTVEALPHPLPTKADAWCPMFSLPLAICKTDADVFAYNKPYLPFVPLPPMDDIKRVAICWAGNADHSQDQWRSMMLKDLLPLADVKNVQLHSFQIGERSKDIGTLGLHGLIYDASPNIQSVHDTLNALRDIDLVVTCDTAMANLAGAAGLPTWVLVNSRGLDFRWGRHGNNAPFYPSVKMWRRGLSESWADVIARVKAALEANA